MHGRRLSLRLVLALLLVWQLTPVAFGITPRPASAVTAVATMHCHGGVTMGFGSAQAPAPDLVPDPDSNTPSKCCVAAGDCHCVAAADLPTITASLFAHLPMRAAILLSRGDTPALTQRSVELFRPPI